MYTYDAIGSFERVGYGCQGSGKELIQPVLDNQLKAASPLVLPEQAWLSSLPFERAVDLVKDAFVSAGERDIYTVRCILLGGNTAEAELLLLRLLQLLWPICSPAPCETAPELRGGTVQSLSCVVWLVQGDDVEIYVMTKDGVSVDTLALKRD